MAAGYWKQVFSGAWAKTYKPLVWDRKKAAVVLLAIGTIVVAGIRLGWMSMITTAEGYLWIAAPPAFAACVLFFWGIFETQAELYRALANKLGPTTTPNYGIWRNRTHIYLGDAACLFAELVPSTNNKARADVREYLGALIDAARNGEMQFVFRNSDANLSRAKRDSERQYVDEHTRVTLDSLRSFASKRGYSPTFLR